MQLLTLFTTMACAMFYPTVNEQRLLLAEHNIAETPYILGISVPPPDVTHITVMEYDKLLWEGIAQGTFAIGEVHQAVKFYENGHYVGQIVPEPTTITTLLFGTILTWTAKRRHAAKTKRAGSTRENTIAHDTTS